MEKACVKCSRPMNDLPRHGLCPRCYAAWRKRELRAGRWTLRYTDAQPVRDHVRRLLAAGLSERRISELSGIDRRYLKCITHRNRKGLLTKKITKANARKLLSIEVPAPGELYRMQKPYALVDSTGTVRRLQSLVAYGYPANDLAKRLGMSRTGVYRIMNHGRMINAQSALRVQQLFDQLQFEPGWSNSARTIGRKRGWPLPLDLDEDEIDWQSMEYVDAPQEKPLTLREQVEELSYLGFGKAEIGERLNLRPYQLRELQAS